MHRLLANMQHAIGTTLVMIMAVVGVAGSVQAQDADPVTLRITMSAPENLDPVQVSRFDAHVQDLVENLFVGLTRYHPDTRDIEPVLAESWTVSDDGLRWTFELREDVQWVRYDPASEELIAVRPVVAGDFVYAIQRACDPLRPSPVTPNLMIVRGCHTVANAFPEVINDLFIAREIGARATGPHTLEIDLLFPSAYLPSLLATPELRPLPREAASLSDGWATRLSSIMTTGPYAITGWTASTMQLARNPYWPDDLAGNIDRVEITFAGEGTSAQAAVAANRADMARLAPEDAAAARAAYPDLYHATQGSLLTVIGFSYDRALVDVTEIRRALALALDKTALVDQLLPEQAQPASQFTPSWVVAAPEAETAPTSPAQAQVAYEAAGFPGCAGVPETLILLTPQGDPLWEELGPAIVEQWAAVLNCHPGLFEIRPVPRTLLIELSHSAYDPERVTRSHMWVATWSADYLDANAWINDALHCRYGYIKPTRECEAADALLDQAGVTGDLAQRADLYAQAEERFFGAQGSFPVIPLFFSTSSWLQQPWLDGVNANGPARFDLWTIDAEARAG